MGLGGNKREDGSFLKVGLARCKVLAFNPNAEQLGKILGTEITKEPEYEGEFTEEVEVDGEAKTFTYPSVRLSVWLEEVGTGMKVCLRIRLIDKIQKTKTGKVRFVDKKGNTSYYLESEVNLQDFMKEVEHWEARTGEYELMEFLKAWQNNIDRRTISDFSLNWNDLLKNKTKEINSWIGSEYEGEVLVLLYVRVVVEENADTGEKVLKEYQEVYNRNFLPGDAIRYFTQKGEIKSKYVKNFIAEITNEEYGLKHYFGGSLGLMRDYVRDENPNATTEPFVKDDAETAKTADY